MMKIQMRRPKNFSIRKFLFLYLIMLSAGMFPSPVYAQKSDSIQALKIHFEQSSGNKHLQAGLHLVEVYVRKHQLDSAENLIHQILRESDIRNNTLQLARLYYKLGDIQYFKNHYADADRIYRKAQDYALRAGDTATYIDLLVERGYIYDYWQKNDSTLALMNKAVTLANKTGYLKGLARASLMIGNLYYGMNRYDKALEYYRKTLDAARRISNRFGMAVAYQNVGICHLYLKNYDKAIENLQKSIEILHQLPQGKVPLGNAYADMAIIYSRLGNVPKTYEYLKQGMDLLKRYGTDEDRAIGYNVSAECMTNLGRYAQSNRYLDSAIAIARKTGFGLMLQKSYKGYALNLRKMNRAGAAFDTILQYIRIKDSLRAEKFHRQLAELDSRYRNLEKQRRIEQLQHRQYLDRLHFRILLGSSLGLILFIGLSAYGYAQKRKRKQKLMEAEKEKAEILARSLNEQLELKNKQLTIHALNMLQKNQLLSEILKEISYIHAQNPSETDKLLTDLHHKIKRLLSSDKDWETFKIYFEQVNKDFVSHLREIQPALSDNDIRLATLLRLNMTNKEIASILNITYQSVRNAQYRLKNKLGLAQGESIREFLSRL